MILRKLELIELRLWRWLKLEDIVTINLAYWDKNIAYVLF